MGAVEAIEAGTVSILIIAHKDRQRHTCDIVVLNQEHGSPEEELAQGLLSITQVFSARLYSSLRIYLVLQRSARAENSSNIREVWYVLMRWGLLSDA